MIQNDYRQVITSVLCDWMGADADALAAAEFSAFADQKLPLIDMGTGVYEKVFSDIAVNIYPNPVGDNLRFTLNIPEAKRLEMNIYNLSGQQLYRKNVTAAQGSNTIGADLSGLSGGFYLLKLDDGKGNTVSKRFIKQ